MSSKTISLKLEAYEKLKGARRYPSESFSEVILRASWLEDTVTAADWLRLRIEEGAILSDEDLRSVEQLKVADRPPDEKWTRR